MNYIWEIAIKLKEQGSSMEQVFFKQAEKYSPYYEQAFVHLNEDDIKNATIEVNSLYRFDELFDELLNPNLEGDELYKQYLFDMVIHMLVEIDLHSGLTKQEYYVRKIQENILDGHYGEKIRDSFGQLEKRYWRGICDYLFMEFQTGSSIWLFSKAIKFLFKDAIVYKDNLNKKSLLLYVGVQQSEEVSMKLNLISDMFLPIEYSLRLFYTKHFGIIDVEQTMILGNVEIL